MTNAPIGMPSGWEEIAAHVCAAYGDRIWRHMVMSYLETCGTNDWAACYTVSAHDWRVEE